MSDEERGMASVVRLKRRLWFATWCVAFVVLVVVPTLSLVEVVLRGTAAERASASVGVPLHGLFAFWILGGIWHRRKRLLEGDAATTTRSSSSADPIR